MRKKLLCLALIVYVLWNLAMYFLSLFKDHTQVIASEPTSNLMIPPLFYILLFLAGAIGFFVDALWFQKDFFYKRFLAMVAIMLFTAGVSGLRAPLEIDFGPFPIFTIVNIFILIWSIKIFIQLFSKNKIQKGN